MENVIVLKHQTKGPFCIIVFQCQKRYIFWKDVFFKIQQLITRQNLAFLVHEDSGPLLQAQGAGCYITRVFLGYDFWLQIYSNR